MGKLDNNFSYIYEKMSNIEYDNMSFKDKLSSMMKAKEVKEVPTNMITNTNVHANENVNSGVEKAKVNSGGSTLLDTFGRLGYGSMISEI